MFFAQLVRLLTLGKSGSNLRWVSVLCLILESLIDLDLSRAVNIPANYLGSAQEQSGRVRQEALDGKYRIIYLTPEFIATDECSFMQSLHRNVGKLVQLGVGKDRREMQWRLKLCLSGCTKCYFQ